jgi:diguanylate cyclase (GGDEF)-like protein
MASKNDGNEKTKGMAEYLLELDETANITVENVEKIANSPRHEKVLSRRFGDNFYSTLVFTLTNEKYEEKNAAYIWQGIKLNRHDMRNKLGRDVGLSVAALDYLTNVLHDIESPRIIEEEKAGNIVDYATQDGLTGLYVRSVFDVFLNKFIEESVRYKTEISLMMMDIDDFKKINDRHGHQVGDEVLTRIGAIIRDEVRNSDLAARYGGEELAIILPHTSSDEAGEVAERIRSRTEEAYRDSLGVTLSIGLASRRFSTSDTPDLVKLADDALYQIKRSGKNRVGIA